MFKPVKDSTTIFNARLLTAVEDNNYDTVKDIIKLKVVDQKTKDEAYTHALDLGHEKIANFLEKKGAKRNPRRHEDNTKVYPTRQYRPAYSEPIIQPIGPPPTYEESCPLPKQTRITSIAFTKETRVCFVVEEKGKGFFSKATEVVDQLTDLKKRILNKIG